MMGQRYYSPELCRFIQPDSIEYLDPESINGLNLYAYCGNNPVNYSDGSGHFPILCTLLFLGGLGSLTSIVSQAVTDIMFDNKFDVNNYLIAAGAGFIGGLCYTIPIPGWNGAIASAVTSGLMTAGQMMYSGQDYGVSDYFIGISSSAIVGGVSSLLFSGLTSNLSYFVDADLILGNLYKSSISNISNQTINNMMSFLIGRGVSTGVISGLFSSIFQKISSDSIEAYRLNKLGLNGWNSFRFAFF